VYWTSVKRRWRSLVFRLAIVAHRVLLSGLFVAREWREESVSKALGVSRSPRGYVVMLTRVLIVVWRWVNWASMALSSSFVVVVVALLEEFVER